MPEKNASLACECRRPAHSWEPGESCPPERVIPAEDTAPAQPLEEVTVFFSEGEIQSVVPGPVENPEKYRGWESECFIPAEDHDRIVSSLQQKARIFDKQATDLFNANGELHEKLAQAEQCAEHTEKQLAAVREKCSGILASLRRKGTWGPLCAELETLLASLPTECGTCGGSGEVTWTGSRTGVNGTTSLRGRERCPACNGTDRRRPDPQPDPSTLGAE